MFKVNSSQPGPSALLSALHTHMLMSFLHKHIHQHQSKSSLVCVRYEHFFPPPQLCAEADERSLISFLFLSVALSKLCQAKYLPQLGDIPGHSPHSQRPGTSRNWKSTLSFFLLNEDIRSCLDFGNYSILTVDASKFSVLRKILKTWCSTEKKVREINM